MRARPLVHPFALAFLLASITAFLLTANRAQAQQPPASHPVASTVAPAGDPDGVQDVAAPDAVAPVASTPRIAASNGPRDSGPPALIPDAASSVGSERITPVVAASLGPAPPEVRRETPRECVTGFLAAAAAENYDQAAYYLDLRSVPPQARKTRGPELARLLAEVTERTVWFDIDAIPDDPEGMAEDAAKAPRDVRIADVPMPGGRQGIRVERVRDAATGNKIWLFSKATVEAVDKLHAEHGLPEIVQQLPSWSRHRFIGLQLWQWGGVVLIALLSWLAGHVLERPTLWAIRRATARRDIRGLDRLATLANGPVRRLAGLVLLRAGLALLSLSATVEGTVTRLVDIGLIFVGMQAAIRVVTFAAQSVLEESLEDDDDITRAKTVATRVTAIRRITIVIIFLVGFALALMQFPMARSAGWSLLGSAGLAGAILGFAAQKTVSNLFAGMLIALTQPMRIGDTVIAEGEWGVVEEIGLTHVVVRVWDLRRLVLPVTWFLEQPFQNWTRTSTEMVGTVFLHADFNVDVELVRTELARILEGQPLWNRKTSAVIVSDLTDRTVALRVTVSADDADKLWDLRCLVRERMLKFLQADASRLPRWRMSSPTPTS